ncbi:aspartate carbamoyltransferase, chloroplastic-like isoform X2 [Olea europaea var. sylvestris]|uniref:aspartate carbamoyltransferase, chloroplastic-like isoform X2 n=1 Tax=Olea europaea var. sylvestris TaxID=158386 RepID=UPI000C1CE591|nr:aspartate carbamoyltransferase, chloroplastic-like isoform X2 [Olea europaea var. sylvestris]
MASSSAFSTWTLNGSSVVPEATKNFGGIICHYQTGCFKETVRCLSMRVSADMPHSWELPNDKLVASGLGRLSLKNKVQCSALEVDMKPSYSVGNKFQLEDVIEAQQFDRNTLSAIFEVALEMEKIEKNSARSQILKGYLMATLFYEPSTRTRLSFESAMKRLGGEVLTTENAREFSSAAKGETLEDTIRTIEGYSDIIVLRHFESGAARKAAATASVPIINAGDGPGQHPTQNDIKDHLTSSGVEWEECSDLMEVASTCDVVYQTRIQRERFGERVDLYEEARGKYIVDRDVLGVMQKHAVVMHPLPRLDEITVDVDMDPRAAYFRQAKNGLYIRMALLKLLLLGW